MSLKEIREKNKLKESIIYAQREGNISPEVAQAVKDDVFHGFIEPLAVETLGRFYLFEDGGEDD